VQTKVLIGQEHFKNKLINNLLTLIERLHLAIASLNHYALTWSNLAFNSFKIKSNVENIVICIDTCYKYTPCLKKTSHLWLAITLMHVNGFWYFLAEMLPIKQAIKRRFTMPPQITCASALPVKNGKTWKSHFFHSIGPGLCYTHNAPVRCLPERKKIVIYDVFDSV